MAPAVERQNLASGNANPIIIINDLTIVNTEGDKHFVFHANLHKEHDHTLCHYLGLRNRAALRRLRVSSPVLFYVDYFHFLTDASSNYLQESAITDVFRLFLALGPEEFSKLPHSEHDIARAYLRQDGTLDENATFETKIHHLASFLVMVVHDMTQLSGSDDAIKSCLGAFNGYPRAFEDSAAAPATVAPFALPEVSWHKAMVPKLISCHDKREHAFEGYQRAYVLVRHAAYHLRPTGYKLGIGRPLFRKNEKKGATKDDDNNDKIQQEEVENGNTEFGFNLDKEVIRRRLTRTIMQDRHLLPEVLNCFMKPTFMMTVTECKNLGLTQPSTPGLPNEWDDCRGLTRSDPENPEEYLIDEYYHDAKDASDVEFDFGEEDFDLAVNPEAFSGESIMVPEMLQG
ncbi:hypothetical protein JX266_003862 [Neoarthrinium moseri]|nr:hypothetical protein JX266_003862 [Neoarthrinium moseri]